MPKPSIAATVARSAAEKAEGLPAQLSDCGCPCGCKILTHDLVCSTCADDDHVTEASPAWRREPSEPGPL